MNGQDRVLEDKDGSAKDREELLVRPPVLLGTRDREPTVQVLAWPLACSHLGLGCLLRAFAVLGALPSGEVVWADPNLLGKP